MVICTVVAGPDAKYTRRGHWVSLVDYDPATNQVWVTDSNDRNNKNAGPIDLITFLKNYEVNSNIVYLMIQAVILRIAESVERQTIQCLQKLQIQVKMLKKLVLSKIL